MNVAFFKQYYFLILQDSSKRTWLGTWDVKLEGMMYVRTVSRHCGMWYPHKFHAGFVRMSCVSSQIPPTRVASSCSLLDQHLRLCWTNILTNGQIASPNHLLKGAKVFFPLFYFWWLFFALQKSQTWESQILDASTPGSSSKLESIKNHGGIDPFWGIDPFSSQADFTWEFSMRMPKICQKCLEVSKNVWVCVWSWRSAGCKQNLAGFPSWDGWNTRRYMGPVHICIYTYIYYINIGCLSRFQVIN